MSQAHHAEVTVRRLEPPDLIATEAVSAWTFDDADERARGAGDCRADPAYRRLRADLPMSRSTWSAAAPSTVASSCSSTSPRS